MWYLKNISLLDLKGHRWLLIKGQEAEEGIIVYFRWSNFKEIPSQDMVRNTLSRLLTKNPADWILAKETRFLFDLDKLRQESPEFASMKWLTGRAFVEPEVRVIPHIQTRAVFDEPISSSFECETRISFRLTPQTIGGQSLPAHTPPEIAESLVTFKQEHPNPSTTAFIMMRMLKTPAHEEINRVIKNTLRQHGITGLRADDKEYNADLLLNVRTYMHGCGFGVAVFERIEQEEFNPNVSLEVGYMLALGKQVCLLKDRTLKTLHADLIGRLYRPFDPQDIAETIPQELPGWLRDKGFGDFAGNP